jgi:hypothetical protein
VGICAADTFEPDWGAVLAILLIGSIAKERET